ncbi:hypothetical protein B9Z55_004440 [Caenorhabditis nigoni]|nr:hypothetical protein B9Z55_004440 [Caenorhabditis nigoni]
MCDGPLTDFAKLDAYLANQHKIHKQQNEDLFNQMMGSLDKIGMDIEECKEINKSLKIGINEDLKEEINERKAQRFTEHRNAVKMQFEIKRQCEVAISVDRENYQQARVTALKCDENRVSPAKQLSVPMPSQKPNGQMEPEFQVTMNKTWAELMEEDGHESEESEGYVSPPEPKVKSKVTIPEKKSEPSRNERFVKQHCRRHQRERHDRRQIQNRHSFRRSRVPNTGSRASTKPESSEQAAKDKEGKSEEKKPETTVQEKTKVENPKEMDPNKYSPMDVTTFRDQDKARAQLEDITAEELNRYTPSTKRRESSSSGFTHDSEEEEGMEAQLSQGDEDTEDEAMEM